MKHGFPTIGSYPRRPVRCPAARRPGGLRHLRQGHAGNSLLPAHRVNLTSTTTFPVCDGYTGWERMIGTGFVLIGIPSPETLHERGRRQPKATVPAPRRMRWMSNLKSLWNCSGGLIGDGQPDSRRHNSNRRTAASKWLDAPARKHSACPNRTRLAKVPHKDGCRTRRIPDRSVGSANRLPSRSPEIAGSSGQLQARRIGPVA
jgi:hypothetical protein